VPNVRRTRFLFFYAEDRGFLDVSELLRGEAKAVTVQQLYAISILTGQEHPITPPDLEALLAIPCEEWVNRAETTQIAEFARGGLIVSDDGGPELADLRRRDEQLDGSGWSLYGALYHSMSRWRDIDVELEERTQVSDQLVAEVAEKVIARFGRPPPHFHTIDGALDVRELPLVEADGGLYRALARRRTTRVFAPDSSLGERELAQLLYYVFGCHGYLEVADGVVGLHRTSPSGGGLHPIEVYPLLISVDGYDSGIYHYDVGRHALELLERLDSAQAAELADQFTCGQFYFKGANALFLLTARFERTFWKYRHERAYAVVLLDAAHLSQTFYLVCADLGLGSFFTAAVNVANIDARLGIDGFSEGALAVVGCGVPSEEESFLNPDFLPYIPRETKA
jgi:putative peptide maturation dehydrogenase